ncbi:MAG: hypothetical protein BWK76_25700 [Desulfobulbaceae bacterium A2]|nr:MAG: hypothetical protein BWK76_25700 [Desulfobulbaceae bacterium A2]
MDSFVWTWTVIVLVVFVILPLLMKMAQRRRERVAREGHDRDEALFQSMFPELQPWFHPERLVAFASARRAHHGPGRTWRWNKPAAFAEADYADCAPDPKGERLRMVNAAGALLTEFIYDVHPEGAVVRVAGGKLTIDIRDRANPRVRYWHPQREFKWTRQAWLFKTPVADEPFSSSSSDSAGSTSSSSSGSSSGTSALAGRGGAFGGGGATGAWDDAAGGKVGTTAAVAATAAAVAVTAGAAYAAAGTAGDSAGEAGGTAY